MKKQIMTSTTLLLLFLSICLVPAQEDITIVAPASEAAEGLDLKAVSELFKDSENFENSKKPSTIQRVLN